MSRARVYLKLYACTMKAQILIFTLLLLVGTLVGPLSHTRADEGPVPLEKVRLQLKWLHQFQFAGFYAAVQQGYYREAGLDVELLEGRANESAIDVVMRGEAEFGLHGADLIVARAKGQKVRSLAAIFQHSPMILLTRRDRGIDTLHELSNKQLLLGPDSAELIAYLKSENVPYKPPVTQQSHDLEALMKGEVDAMPAYSTDQVFLLDKANIPFSQFSPRAAGIDFYGDVLFTSDKEISKNPDRVRRFLEASLRGWYYALSHREEMARLIYTQYSQRHSIEHLLFEAEQTRRLMTPELVEIGYQNSGRWRHIADTFAELGMMPADYSLEDFIFERNQKEVDYSRYYWTVGIALFVVALAMWVSLYFLRLNRALRKEATERKRLQDNLEHLANTDELTQMPNRRAFMTQLEIELSRHHRYGNPFCLLMLDLDHFKQINDQCGHAAGDEALKMFANVVQCCLRSQDLAGRLGGEEFAIFLPETDVDMARVVALRIRDRLAQSPHPMPDCPVRVTVSIGVAAAMADDTLQTLLQQADTAMYAAKQAGRNRVEVSDRVSDKVSDSAIASGSQPA